MSYKDMSLEELCKIPNIIPNKTRLSAEFLREFLTKIFIDLEITNKDFESLSNITLSNESNVESTTERTV